MKIIANSTKNVDEEKRIKVMDGFKRAGGYKYSWNAMLKWLMLTFR